MAKCNFCGKGAQVGNAVSHAKNRTKRWFRPNIQKLKVLSNGQSTRVALCTKCIKRLKKDGHIGGFNRIKHISTEEKSEKPVKSAEIKQESKQVKESTVLAPEKKKVTKVKKAEKLQKSSKKEEPVKPAMSIDDIVGKRS